MWQDDGKPQVAAPSYTTGMEVHERHVPGVEDALGAAALVVILAGQCEVGIKRQGHHQLQQLFLLTWEAKTPKRWGT